MYCMINRPRKKTVAELRNTTWEKLLEAKNRPKSLFFKSQICNVYQCMRECVIVIPNVDDEYYNIAYCAIHLIQHIDANNTRPRIIDAIAELVIDQYTCDCPVEEHDSACNHDKVCEE